MRTFFIIIMILVPQVSSAEYYVQGKVYGNFCKGVGIKVCGDQRIDATEMDGRPYEIKRSFSRVDESKGGTCFIYIQAEASFWGKMTKKALGNSPTFYQYRSGPSNVLSSYKKLGTPEYIRFKC